VAAHNGHKGVVEVLIAAGADVRGDNGCDPQCADVHPSGRRL
jgi:hypothetical protein